MLKVKFPEEEVIKCIKDIQSNVFPNRELFFENSIPVTVWEYPQFLKEDTSYYAIVDPPCKGKQQKAAYIYIYAKKHYKHEFGYIVCKWEGIADNVVDTYLQLNKIISMYNAKVICENNCDSFIQYLIFNKKQDCLIKREELSFLKDNLSIAEYGWKNIRSIQSIVLEKAFDLLKLNDLEHIPDKDILDEILEYYKTEELGSKFFNYMILLTFLRS